MFGFPPLPSFCVVELDLAGCLCHEGKLKLINISLRIASSKAKFGDFEGYMRGVKGCY